jgi:hypothetical protein
MIMVTIMIRLCVTRYRSIQFPSVLFTLKYNIKIYIKI